MAARSTLNCGCRQDHRDIVLDRVTFSASTGCWLWRGSFDAGGYGRFAHRQRVAGQPSRRVAAFAAHRFAYEAFVGPIPDGLELDHLCRVPACCNPAHLEPVTSAENIRRMVAARGFLPRDHDAGRCHHGHTLHKRGSRGWYCPTCQRERYQRGLPDGDPRHGTNYAYANFGCRCEACSEAARAYRRAVSERKAAAHARP